MPFQFTLRRLLACAVFAHVTSVYAGPLPETCNAAQDNATLQWQVPSSLQPGVPAHVTVRATNSTAFDRTWIGEEQKNFPYRLASWSQGSGIPNNQVLWSNWSCNGYNV